MKKIFFILTIVLSLVFAGCSKEEEHDSILLNRSEITLHPGDTYQIEATSNLGISYYATNKFHASVTRSGLVTAWFAGETKIRLFNDDDTKDFKVIIKPEINLYSEPAVKFGDNKSSIRTKFGSPYRETSSEILYANYSNTVPYIMFQFDGNNKLNGYIVMLNSIYVGELSSFLLERYFLEYNNDNQDGLWMFINGLQNANNATKPTIATGIGLLYKSYHIIRYIPFTDTNTAIAELKKTDTSIFDELLNK
ncbi:MAG: hypothetical protein LBH32_13490 [Dysgonamonadaceae bacterium]|jgi:hypothetical protein|nr:hypothetical protein [Dysgonamonadaceae bacterium]